MRNIYYSIFILASILLLTGCDLTREPETTFTDSAFWKTETDLRGACNRMYNLLEGFSHDTRSDELVKTSADEVSAGFRTVPATSSNWSNPYDRIYTANNIIAKADNADLSEEAINRWKAEAYFFRAYYHFSLVKRYGDVPLLTKAIDDLSDPMIYSGRTPREEVIQQCYEDLDFAAKWLPTASDLSESDWGRVTHSAALALKMRIALYEGSFSKYHSLGSDYNSHFQVAISAAETIIAEGEHDLYPDFQSLFLFEGEGRQNKENIFVKVYGPNGEGTVTHGNCRQMENSVSLTRQMVDLFLYADGLPREKSALKTLNNDTSYNDIFVNRDPRLAMTIYQYGEEAYKGAYIPFNNQHGNGYSLKKGFLLSEWTTNSKETIDKMIIRYAEVLISYAEALYEKNGSITDEQLDKTINAVRARVGLNAKLSNAFVSANGLNMRDEIRRERTVEFIDENFRFDDIIRWKIAEKVLPVDIIGEKWTEDEASTKRVDLEARLTDSEGKLNGVQVYSEGDIYVIELASTRRFDADRDYLYPIPLNEIALSKNAVTQNPNWE